MAAVPRSPEMIVSTGVHPHWRQVARTSPPAPVTSSSRSRCLTTHQWESVDLADAARSWRVTPNTSRARGPCRSEALGCRARALFVVAADPVAAGV